MEEYCKHDFVCGINVSSNNITTLRKICRLCDVTEVYEIVEKKIY